MKQKRYNVEKMITNFTRHTIRNHGEELEVSKVPDHPNGSTEEITKLGKLFNSTNCFGGKRGIIAVGTKPCKDLT